MPSAKVRETRGNIAAQNRFSLTTVSTTLRVLSVYGDDLPCFEAQAQERLHEIAEYRHMRAVAFEQHDLFCDSMISLRAARAHDAECLELFYRQRRNTERWR